MEPRLNYVEHEPKMRLFKTHSHTSERRGRPLSRQGTLRKRGKKGGLSVRDKKNVNENHRHVT